MHIHILKGNPNKNKKMEIYVSMKIKISIALDGHKSRMYMSENHNLKTE